MSQSSLSAISSSFNFLKSHPLAWISAFRSDVFRPLNGSRFRHSTASRSCTKRFLTAQITSSCLVSSPNLSWTREIVFRTVTGRMPFA